MKIIVGLGNPGREYEETRHNAGFKVLDLLADELGLHIREKKFNALYTKGMYGAEKLILLKPQTYMNNSGISVRAVADFYQVGVEDIIVVFDDINLPPGQIRIRSKGSAGGHNGIKSIIAHLGSQDFPRVKVGVGEKKENEDLAWHVLARFAKSELKPMREAYEDAVKALLLLIEDRTDFAMNIYNKARTSG